MPLAANEEILWGTSGKALQVQLRLLQAERGVVLILWI